MEQLPPNWEAYSADEKRAYLAGMREGMRVMRNTPGIYFMLLSVIEQVEADIPSNLKPMSNAGPVLVQHA